MKDEEMLKTCQNMKEMDRTKMVSKDLDCIDKWKKHKKKHKPTRKERDLCEQLWPYSEPVNTHEKAL